MSDTTTVVSNTAYQSNLTKAYSQRGAEVRRAAAVDAALELLHAMALAGKVSKASDVAKAIGPIADAIQKAVDAKAVDQKAVDAKES